MNEKIEKIRNKIDNLKYECSAKTAEIEKQYKEEISKLKKLLYESIYEININTIEKIKNCYPTNIVSVEIESRYNVVNTDEYETKSEEYFSSEKYHNIKPSDFNIKSLDANLDIYDHIEKMIKSFTSPNREIKINPTSTIHHFEIEFDDNVYEMRLNENEMIIIIDDLPYESQIDEDFVEIGYKRIVIILDIK